MVTWVLVLYGVAGILSSILYTKLYDKHHKPFLYFAVCGIGAALFMLYPASWFIPATIAVCAFWGIAIMTFNLVLQSLVIEVAPPAAVTLTTTALGAAASPIAGTPPRPAIGTSRR